jgi:5'-3' exonuclease
MEIPYIEIMEIPLNFVFIDGSYFCFYRYYSIVRWWKNAHPDEPLSDPFTNPIFAEKFRKTFVEHVSGIPKNLNIQKENVFMIVGKDCKRENIWRNEFYDKYKATRPPFAGGHAFKMAYEDNLFIEGGVKSIISHPKLEGDDSIALSVKYILNKYQHQKVNIYIITSDKDYLQLVEPRVQIFNLMFKNIAEQKSSVGDAKMDLFCKIVMGDTSDNIPSVLSKCGPKTALKCYHDKAYFDERMKKENAYDKWTKNQLLVDFNYIPQHLVDEFMLKIDQYF